MMLQRVFRVYLLLQIGAYPTPVAASGRQINGTASAGNYIHAEQEVDLSSAGKRSLISITSDVPVTVQRYSDNKSLVGQQPVPKNMAKVLVTSNCDTGQTQVVPDITVSSTGSYITVTLDVEEEDADAMPFLEPSSYSAFWTWITDGCGLNPTSVSPFDGDEDVTITRQERKLVSRTCGFEDATCEAGEFCQLDNELDTGACNSQGVCTTMTTFCTEEYDPVCGCDGTTYSNACFAHSAGAIVSRRGECEVPPSEAVFVQDPAVTDDITTPSSCEPSETCYEEGSTCATGTETCCGETHNAMECMCHDNGEGLLQYSCFYTDACMMPSCCRPGPPLDKPPPAPRTCNIGEPCDSGLDDDYCCHDELGGGDWTYCSKSGGNAMSFNDETAAVPTTTTTASEATTTSTTTTTSVPTTTTTASEATTTSTTTTTSVPTTTTAASEATSTTMTIELPTTTVPSAPYPCADCIWHESTMALKTCTNSPSYPRAWDTHPEARAYFFFETARECCDTRFQGECTVSDVDVGGESDDGEEFAPLGPRSVEDFEGYPESRGLPFDLGDGWRVESGVSRSGSHSVTNVPSNEPGASADLTLKVLLSRPSTVSCMAKIDTSMPYELFYIVVNGEQRNTYHSRSNGGWMTVLTGLGPGENTVVFRVQNTDSYAGTPIEYFGNGKVWLDDCVVG